MKKILFLLLSVLLLSSCPNSVGGDPGGDPGGDSNDFAGKTYGVRIEGGARYYGFTPDTLTITEETTKSVNRQNRQNRMLSSVANQSEPEMDYFIPYQGPYTTDGDTVKYDAMNGDPVETNFEFKEDGSFSVETTTRDKKTGDVKGEPETVLSNATVEEEVVAPVLPDTMVNHADLIGLWEGTVVGEPYVDYMEFTENTMISYWIEGEWILDEYEFPYIAQFGIDKNGKNEKGVKIRNSGDEEFFDDPDDYFDSYITFNDEKTVFTLDSGIPEEPFLITYKKITELPGEYSDFTATVEGLYGNWETEGFRDAKYYTGENGELVATVTQSVKYAFNPTKSRTVTKVITSDYTGTKYTYALVGAVNDYAEDATYVADGASIVVTNTGSYGEAVSSLTFVSEDVFYLYGDKCTRIVDIPDGPGVTDLYGS